MGKPPLINGEPAKTLRDFFLAHLAEKVTNPICNCCDHSEWTVLATSDHPNEHSYVPHGQHNEVIQKGGWPVLGVVCRNCSNVRWFAAQPIIDEFDQAMSNR